jgi:hypothetical protein
MTQHIQVIENRVTKSDADTVTRSRQIGYRAEDLISYAQAGYALAHTATIEGEEYVTFVDTLTRNDE